MSSNIVEILRKEISQLSMAEIETDSLKRECSSIPCVYLGNKEDGLKRECSSIPCVYLGNRE